MKKFLSALLAALLVLTGCAAGASRPENAIVATNFALYDLARQAYPGACVMLISPGTESHDYECTLSDMAAIASASLVLYGSGEGDAWMNDVLIRLADAGENVPYLRAMDVIAGERELLPEGEALEAHDHDHDHDGHEEVHDHDHETAGTALMTAREVAERANSALYLRTDAPTPEDAYRWDGWDEHVWTDPANAVLILRAIADALEALSLPVQDTAEYVDRLICADENFRALAQSGQMETLLFADRFPFLYFTHTYGLTWTAAFSGCSSNTEPSMATLVALLAEMEELSPKSIYVIEFSDGKTAEFLVAAQREVHDACAEIRTLYSAHNVSAEDFENGVTYADLLERNYRALIGESLEK